MEPYGDVAEVYRRFAAEAAGESPCFVLWAESVAEDAAVLAWLGTLPPLKRQPNLVFAAARWHGVPAPGPYDGLRSALLEDSGALRATILARSTQTNEAGRLATLVPALASLAAGLPARELSLVEVGASAGLCLFPDSYDYRWTTPQGERRLEGSGGPTLSAHVEGGAPLPDTRLEVAWRAGIDLNPLDVTDDDAMRWLENLVWPEQEHRRSLLTAAIAVTRRDPPRIVRGDMLEALPEVLEEAPGVPVVFHSAVAAYLDEAHRADFAAMMNDLVRSGACHWISNEGPSVVPGVEVPDDVPPARFLLCVDGRPVAWTHGHGSSATWL